MHFPPKMHFFKPKYVLLTSHSVRDMCGSNLNQSRYKISLESLLHRVQSCGQSGFPSYRCHCPLYFLRLDPVNNQLTDAQTQLICLLQQQVVGSFFGGLNICLSCICRYSNYRVITLPVSCRHLSLLPLAHFVLSDLINTNLLTISENTFIWHI